MIIKKKVRKWIRYKKNNAEKAKRPVSETWGEFFTSMSLEKAELLKITNLY